MPLTELRAILIAGMLNLNWVIDGRRDDTPPGGALIFELRQRPESSTYEVITYYTAQTLEQMRNLTPLTLDNPPPGPMFSFPAAAREERVFPANGRPSSKP
jgi:4-phytase/acid phosphatase